MKRLAIAVVLMSSIVLSSCAEGQPRTITEYHYVTEREIIASSPVTQTYIITKTNTQVVTLPPVTKTYTITKTNTQVVTLPPITKTYITTETNTQVVTLPPVTKTNTQVVTLPPVTKTVTITRTYYTPPTAENAPAIVNHPVGPGYDGLCGICHMIGGTDPMPDDGYHEDFDVDECYDCHKEGAAPHPPTTTPMPPYPSTTKPGEPTDPPTAENAPGIVNHPAGPGYDGLCGICHMIGGTDPMPDDGYHKDFDVDECYDCHKEG